MKIGVLDSGIGGLDVLYDIKKSFPYFDYIYYGDSINNPYGEKDENELFVIVNNIVEFLIKRKCRIIILACNTATISCKDKLQKTHPDTIFIGITPPIKKACKKNFKNILVLATPITINSKKIKNEIEKNKQNNQNIILIPCYGLASAIEKNNKYEARTILKKLLTPYKESKIDCIILGCTHYPLVKDDIKELFNNVEIIDGNEKVIQKIKTSLKKINYIPNKNILGKTLIYNSLTDNEIK